MVQVATKKTRLVKWHKYTSPADSALPDPFLSGIIGCYLVAMGIANSEIVVDLNKVDPGFSKLKPIGKRAFAHGVKQRLVDGTGNKTPAEAYTIMRDMARLLESGSWFATRENATARKLNLLASDMAEMKFSVKFTEENRSAMIELVSSADEKKIEEWVVQVAPATLARKARELEAAKKELAEKAKKAPALTF